MFWMMILIQQILIWKLYYAIHKMNLLEEYFIVMETGDVAD